MVDPDQPAEDLDDDKLGGEFPPDRPMAVEDEGVTGIEQLGGESFAERDERTEPEPWEPHGEADSRDEPPVGIVGDEEVDAVDDEGQMVARRAGQESSAGPLEASDTVTGDETTRDVATERVTPPAEESAVHVDDDAPGATP